MQFFITRKAFSIHTYHCKTCNNIVEKHRKAARFLTENGLLCVFMSYLLRGFLIFACAAARRAMGTR